MAADASESALMGIVSLKHLSLAVVGSFKGSPKTLLTFEQLTVQNSALILVENTPPWTTYRPEEPF